MYYVLHIVLFLRENLSVISVGSSNPNFFDYFSLLLIIKAMSNAQENTSFFNNWQEWKSDVTFLFKTICAVATIIGQGMIIYYIKRHAPKERPINKLVLIDQVCAYN